MENVTLHHWKIYSIKIVSDQVETLGLIYKLIFTNAGRVQLYFSMESLPKFQFSKFYCPNYSLLILIK